MRSLVVLLGLVVALLVASLVVEVQAQKWLTISALVVVLVAAVVSVTVQTNSYKKLDLEWSDEEKGRYADVVKKMYANAEITGDDWIDWLNNDACIALAGFGAGVCDAFDKRMKDDSGNMTDRSMTSFLLSLDDDQLLRVGGYALHKLQTA